MFAANIASADAGADALLFSVEYPQQLRHVIGAPLVVAVAGDKRFAWDASSVTPDNGVSVLRPDALDGAGRWMRVSTNAGVGLRDAELPTCADSTARPVSLLPAAASDDVRTQLEEAVNRAAASRCPIIVEPGVYPVAQDVSIARSDITLYCKRGAVFRKMAEANAIWLNGDRDRMIGRCEIDGHGWRGSGLIVGASATGVELAGLYVHDNVGHGVLNKGRGTRAYSVRTERNAEVGFANDGAKYLEIVSLVSRSNGEEGLTIDNPGTEFIRVVGGYIAGDCRTGGVGNVGIDAAVDVSVVGLIVKDPGSACPWNLTAQNNVGDTRRLTVLGGVFAGTLKGDIHFRTNTQRHYVVSDSLVQSILSSSPSAVLMDEGSSNDRVIDVQRW